ncbi:TPA: hypothetical protein ACGO44_001522 [Streptococcus suis]
MKAGYLVGHWIMNTLKSRGVNGAISLLAGSIGYGTARYFVTLVAKVGATAAATSLAGYFGVGSSFAGPLGWIVGSATGWL